MELTGIDKINRQLLIDTLTKRMVTREDDITCSGGESTKTYLDVPGALGDGAALRLATKTFTEHLVKHGYLPTTEHGIQTMATAIGGPTTGAIPLVLGIAMDLTWYDDLKWFIVRDKVKEHGLGRMFVGGEPTTGDTVILTDDVVSSGRSLVETVGVVLATGAKIAAVVPLVDRGTQAAKYFERLEIPYLPVLTYTDLGLPPLGE